MILDEKKIESHLHDEWGRLVLCLLLQLLNPFSLLDVIELGDIL